MNKTEGPNAHDVQSQSALIAECDCGGPADCYQKTCPWFPYDSNAFSHLKPAPKSHKIVIWSLLTFASLVTWYCVVNYGVLK